MKELYCGGIRAVQREIDPGQPGPDFLSPETVAPVRRFHETVEGYGETPLVRLDGLAKRLGLRGVFVKDESPRFGLNAFKGLGGSYALFRVVCRELGLDAGKTTFSDLKAPAYRERVEGMVFVTATDGNHGKGVAWAAGVLGCEAHVYMPAGSVEVRAQAIRDAGRAEVTILEVGYDDAVRYAADMAEKHGWYLVQDTSWEGYADIPAWIVQGYTTMAAEAADQLQAAGVDRPTHVFLQAGVGAMAGGVLGYLANRWADCRPVFSVVEPTEAACIYRSALVNDGAAHPAEGSGVTLMAGLNCGEPCLVTWPVLRDLASWFFACPDSVTEKGMALLGRPVDGDAKVVSGESGAVTAGLLSLLCEDPDCRSLREGLRLEESSVVLLFSTEGNTDPEHYRAVLERSK